MHRNPPAVDNPIIAAVVRFRRAGRKTQMGVGPVGARWRQWPTAALVSCKPQGICRGACMECLAPGDPGAPTLPTRRSERAAVLLQDEGAQRAPEDSVPGTSPCPAMLFQAGAEPPWPVHSAGGVGTAADRLLTNAAISAATSSSLSIRSASRWCGGTRRCVGPLADAAAGLSRAPSAAGCGPVRGRRSESASSRRRSG
jgi:hypothetical protein